MVSLHFVFNKLNAKHEYRLFLVWATLSDEMPVKERSVVGWSEEESNRFWEAEKRFNQIWNRTMNVFFVVLCFMFNFGLFLSRFEVHVFTYVTVQTIQVVHNR